MMDVYFVMRMLAGVVLAGMCLGNTIFTVCCD